MPEVQKQPTPETEGPNVVITIDSRDLMADREITMKDGKGVPKKFRNIKEMIAEITEERENMN